MAVSLVLSFSIVLAGLAHADQYDEKIKALQNLNSQNQQQVDQFGSQASSYQDEISRLNVQIGAVQAAISDYQRQSDDLQAQIVQDQKEIEYQKQVLGESIKTIYLEDQVSTLEILASSNDLSDFVNKQVDRNAVQTKIKDTLDRITKLKTELEQKQRDVQNILADQKNQEVQLNGIYSKQAGLLAYTQTQIDTYNKQIKTNNSQIASLRAQQLAANRRLGGSAVAGDPNHGGYPSKWDNASQDSMIDDWGMYNRECVSYTAWKVYQAYGYMPYWGGVGNAKQWPGDAVGAGIPTGSTPKVGSVAISTSGYYGHAMWVEAVDGDNIYVSQYNYDLNGHYSEMSIKSSGLTYIYFGDR